MSPAPLRPLRVGEILDTGIKLYVRNARTLMAAAATVVIPLQVLSAVVLVSTYSNGDDISTGLTTVFRRTTAAEAHARLGASTLNFVVGLIGGALVTAACIKAVSGRVVDQPTSTRTSLRFALRRSPALVGLLVLYHLCLVLGFVLLIVPGIWVYGALSVATPALLIEGLGPAGAIGRSRRLVSGRWWPTAGVLLVINVLVAVLGGVITGILTAIALGAGTPSVLFVAMATSASGIVTGILVQPLMASVTTVLYYDLRVRREGYDLQLLAEQLGLPEGSLGDGVAAADGFAPPMGPEQVGRPGGPPYWPPPPGWRPET